MGSDLHEADLFLGSKEFYLLFMPFLYWCWDARLGFRVGLILVLTQGLNQSLKIAIHSQRPYWVNPEVKALGSELSFGMPSGHAQGAVGIWGITANRIQHLWAYALAFGISLLIGFSRIYLGVHLPEDVGIVIDLVRQRDLHPITPCGLCRCLPECHAGRVLGHIGSSFAVHKAGTGREVRGEKEISRHHLLDAIS